MVIFSLVSPIVDPLYSSLGTLKIFLTGWGTYITSVQLTIYPPCSFIFTVPFRSHFIFWPFPTVTSILNHLILVIFFFVYVICNDAMLSPNHSMRSSLLSLSETSPQNVAPTNRFSTSSSFCLLFNQQSTTLWSFSPQFYILCWNVVFCYYCFCFFYFRFPINLMFCDHICHICCTCPWRTCSFFLSLYRV